MYNEYDAGPLGGGPMVSGKWMNKRTGQTVIVRDSVMDGDNMFIMTDKGQLDGQTFMRDYIQASDEIYNDAGQVVATQAVDSKEIMTDTYSSTPMQTTAPRLTSSTPSKPVKVEINNYELIDKIFKKNESKPKITFDIDWADFPAKELQMLVDYFDVSKEDISKYIVQTMVNQQEIADSLGDFVNNKM